MSWKGSVVASTYVVVLLLCLNLLSFTMVTSQILPPLLTPPPSQNATCPTNLEACVSLLNTLNTDYGNANVNITIGSDPCCDPVQGLTDIQAAACICAAVKDSVLGSSPDGIATGFSTTLGNCLRDDGGFRCT